LVIALMMIVEHEFGDATPQGALHEALRIGIQIGLSGRQANDSSPLSSAKIASGDRRHE
jgi:hypothetical protein